MADNLGRTRGKFNKESATVIYFRNNHSNSVNNTLMSRHVTMGK